MDLYLHDSATTFRFVLRGELIGRGVQDLEEAWITAQSVLNGKELVVDVSGIRGADQSGVDLLFRMRESGARLTVTLPLASEEFLRSLGLRVAVPGGRRRGKFALQCLRFAKLDR